MLMGPPMAVSQLALACWLMAKGLASRPHPAGAEAGAPSRGIVAGLQP
jgi:hypothetical protein